MTNFGEPFKQFSSFGIAHLSVPDAEQSLKALKGLGTNISSRSELAELKPSSAHRLAAGEKASITTVGKNLRIVTHDQLSVDSRKKILEQVKIEVAPVARVYAITDLSTLSDDAKKNLSGEVKQNLNFFNYYVVELGLNVLVGQEAKIPALLFEVDLYSNGKDRTDVTTNSIVPTTSMRTLMSGSVKISIGLDKALKLIPVVGQAAADIVSVDITGLEFKWELKRYNIATSGPLNYETYWRIYNTSNVEGFNPMMVLKAKKQLTKIYAQVRATYSLKMKGFFTDAEVYSDEKEIAILPIA